jgi:hypothetical protein
VSKYISWLLWGVLTLGLGGYLTYSLLADEQAPPLLSKQVFLLSGQTTHGHHQIEMACSVCHTPFQGVKQEACLDCHGEELKVAEDSHPKRKFTDPRNAERVALLDARTCITCHREHKPEVTHAMAVTQPDDFCVLCHCDIAEERPSHVNLKFDSCASAGCHNYHDNRALYEDFLVKHLYEIHTKDEPRVPLRNLGEVVRAASKKPVLPLTIAQQDAPATLSLDPQIAHEWETTSHAQAGVNCMDCHGIKHEGSDQRVWQDRLDPAACKECHVEQVQGFLASRHGMRLAQGLSPMQPALARLPMKEDAKDKQLSCNTCHKAHRFDTREAAAEGCLGCHDDAHSRAYKNSPHFRLWQAELTHQAPAGTGVSCATCHLPREVHKQQGMDAVQVQHNQNDNLRPNEKMIRNVCMTCHGLEFSIDALADPQLLASNFKGTPTRHVKSLDWAERRLWAERRRKLGIKREQDRDRKPKSVTCAKRLHRNSID